MRAGLVNGNTGGRAVTGRRNRGVIPFLGAAMAAGVSSLSSAGMALPATVLKSEGMGRERGG